MEKSIFGKEYGVVTELLRRMRESAGCTQEELAERLGKSQSFVSKFERGERLLDVIQLRTICITLGTSLPDFVRQLEKQLQKRQMAIGEDILRG